MQKLLSLFAIVVVMAAPAFGVSADQRVYKYVDEQGNVEFSDKPPAPGDSAEPVELNPANRSAPPPDIAKPVAKAPVARPEYDTVITAPSDGSTIPMGPGNFAVAAQANPALASGERLQLLIDGAPVGKPQRGSSWQLSNVFRGEHKLVVKRLLTSGGELDRSEPVTVYVLRPSIR
ncbi:conserved hypothetical protein [Luminiphilus syltensis NOR5-1B]|uniref:DUF4124 domain-containing protein n=1 Tax=Luminiphilus syltensis NOR5-1B TaxID=565045 RepID=B8KUP2_9GAMM|nr:DUF4124 domain-containing protein [Luminiphilus syltensis]EED36337.1 conserved hypothetical protein [Luminiphilus syltensis NOR5-1B]